MLYHPSTHISLSLYYEPLKDKSVQASAPCQPIKVLHQDDYRIPIIQADEHFLCIDKPPFLRIDSKEDEVKDEAEQESWTAQKILKRHLLSAAPRPAALSYDPLASITVLKQVHQLDANTSGVFVYAKHKSAAAEASHLFQDRQANKTYLAILNGHVDMEELLPGHTETGAQILPQVACGNTRSDLEACDVAVVHMLRIDAYTQSVSAEACAVVASPGPDAPRSRGKGHPQAASTLLRPLHLFNVGPMAKSATLVQLKPITGRRHQLRVHCAAIGHAILGDWLYEREPTLDCGRMCLHAFELRMTFPDVELLRGNRKRNKRGKLVQTDHCEPVDYNWKTELPFLDVLDPAGIRRLQDLV